jgi:hypothetical protein
MFAVIVAIIIVLKVMFSWVPVHLYCPRLGERTQGWLMPGFAKWAGTLEYPYYLLTVQSNVSGLTCPKLIFPIYKVGIINLFLC